MTRLLVMEYIPSFMALFTIFTAVSACCCENPPLTWRDCTNFLVSNLVMDDNGLIWYRETFCVWIPSEVARCFSVEKSDMVVVLRLFVAQILI